MARASWFTSRSAATAAALTAGAGVVAGTAAAIGSQIPSNIQNNNLLQSQYDFRYRVFPDDLGTDQHGHYMVININVPVDVRGNPRGNFANYSNILNNEYSKVDTLRFGTPQTGTLSGGTTSAGPSGSFLALPRFTRRIKESIALYMPTPMVFSSQNAYEEIGLTAIAAQAGRLGAIAATAGTSAARGRALQEIINSAGRANAIVGGAGRVISQASRILGMPINPRVEVLFATTEQRQFIFEVLMAPRNEKESEIIKSIVQTLRFHAAPELDFGGFAFIPPAEFDITFFNKGVENTNIPRINTCVMEKIEVEYSPTDGIYSTFENGHPVSVRLSMAFREVEILHKTRVDQGF